MMEIKSPREFASGVFLLLIAGFIFWAVWDLPMWRGVRLGPGYVPSVLALMVGVFGLVVVIRAFLVESENETPLTWNPKGVALVLGAIFVFAYLLEGFGLVVAAPALLIIAGFAVNNTRLVESLIFTVAMTFGAIALFSWGLGLTIKVWP